MCRYVQSPWDEKQFVNKWIIKLSHNGQSETFEYFTGSGIDINDHDEILSGAVSSIMSDAMIIEDNSDPIDYLIDDLGYEDYKTAKKIADGCTLVHGKLSALGLYNEALAH